MHQAGRCKMQLKPIAGGTKLIVGKSPCNGLSFRRRWKGMIISEEQREENFQEYLRLLKDPDYYDVYFDEQSGGVSAIHKDHQFDKKTGPFGIRKGDYERNSVTLLRKKGHHILLESELAPEGIKTPDGLIDGVRMDIKAVEGYGKWAIKDKFYDAIKKGVECVIMYFHKRELYSLDRIEKGWRFFLLNKDSQRYRNTLKRVICIIESHVEEWVIPK